MFLNYIIFVICSLIHKLLFLHHEMLNINLTQNIQITYIMLN